MPAYSPSPAVVENLARDGALVPVYREILGDLLTPVSCFVNMQAAGRSDHAFLFESVEGGERWGRYSFLGNNPRALFESRGRSVTITRGQDTETTTCDDALEALKDFLAREHVVPVEGLPRFYGGAVGYFGYDMVRFIERLPEQTTDDLGVPDSVFFLTDTLVIVDNQTQRIKVLALADPARAASVHDAYTDACERIDALVDQIQTPAPAPAVNAAGDRAAEALAITANMSPDQFKRGVARALEYIRAGDIIQVVLSQRFAVDQDGMDPFAMYRAVRDINPSPYLFYLTLRDMQLIGSSPEVMVRVEDGRAVLRPIAGTRPRGATPDADEDMAAELLTDPKEMAEHVMLVDLGRNDLGRVAQIGTVAVDEFAVIEKYSHVMHIVSNVVCALCDGVDAFDVFRATFPAGTLTGAPKVRAMEIIDELEPTRRGPYGGSVGYLGYGGNMDICITIRTALVANDRIYVQAGAGIVADSVPDNEQLECENKAKALLRAVERARTA